MNWRVKCAVCGIELEATSPRPLPICGGENVEPVADEVLEACHQLRDKRLAEFQAHEVPLRLGTNDSDSDSSDSSDRLDFDPVSTAPPLRVSVANSVVILSDEYQPEKPKLKPTDPRPVFTGTREIAQEGERIPENIKSQVVVCLHGNQLKDGCKACDQIKSKSAEIFSQPHDYHRKPIVFSAQMLGIPQETIAGWLSQTKEGWRTVTKYVVITEDFSPLQKSLDEARGELKAILKIRSNYTAAANKKLERPYALGQRNSLYTETSNEVRRVKNRIKRFEKLLRRKPESQTQSVEESVRDIYTIERLLLLLRFSFLNGDAFTQFVRDPGADLRSRISLVDRYREAWKFSPNSNEWQPWATFEDRVIRLAFHLGFFEPTEEQKKRYSELRHRVQLICERDNDDGAAENKLALKTGGAPYGSLYGSKGNRLKSFKTVGRRASPQGSAENNDDEVV